MREYWLDGVLRGPPWRSNQHKEERRNETGIAENEISEGEVQKAIRKLNGGKAAGVVV